VGIDLLDPEQRPHGAGGVRGELERGHAVVVGCGVGEEPLRRPERGRHDREEPLRPLAIGHVLEEAERLPDRVRVVRRLALELVEAEGGRPVEPGVAHAVRVEPGRGRGGRPDARLVRPVAAPVLGVRVVEHAAEGERHRAPLVGDAREERAGAVEEPPGRSSRVREQLECERHVDRLARRAPLVRLEPVAEAAVLVAVRRERPRHALGRRALEQRREQPLLQHARVPSDEVAGCLERRRHGRHTTRGRIVRRGA
jgi:hypothetical protein